MSGAADHLRVGAATAQAARPRRRGHRRWSSCCSPRWPWPPSTSCAAARDRRERRCRGESFAVAAGVPVRRAGAPGAPDRRRRAPRRDGDHPVPRHHRPGGDRRDPRGHRRRRAAGQGPAAGGRGAGGEVAGGGRAHRPAARPLHLRAEARGRRREFAGRRHAGSVRRVSGARRLRIRGARRAPPLPPAFPGKKAVAAAREWIAGRDGDVAFAVVDANGEPAGGYREHEPFQLASLSKAIMLVASLRDDPTPDATTEATLTKMITESDNGAAYTIYGQVGARGHARGRQGRRHAGLRAGLGLGRHALVRLGPGALLLAARVTGARRGARASRGGCSRASSPSSAGASRRRRGPRAGPATSRAAGWAWTTSSWSRPPGWRRARRRGRSP